MFASLRCLQWAPWVGHRFAIFISIDNGINTVNADIDTAADTLSVV